MQQEAFLRGMNDPDLKYSEEERNEIVQHMIEDRAWRAHATKTMEECAELQVEEMADVYISLWIIQEVFDISTDDIDKAIDVKLKRNEFRHQSRKEQKRKDELEGRIF